MDVETVDFGTIAAGKLMQAGGEFWLKQDATTARKASDLTPSTFASGDQVISYPNAKIVLE